MPWQRRALAWRVGFDATKRHNAGKADESDVPQRSACDRGYEASGTVRVRAADDSDYEGRCDGAGVPYVLTGYEELQHVRGRPGIVILRKESRTIERN